MNLAKINSSLKLPVVQILALIPLIYLILPNYLSSTSYLCEGAPIYVGSCLDPSWVVSINWAVQKGLVFGRDYIFTYGALGFLATRNALGFNPLVFVIFDIFVVANLGYIFLYTIRRYQNVQTVALCLLSAATIASGSMYVDQIVFILLLISIFWLHYSLKHARLWSWAIPVIITCLLFYIKVNISFVGLVIFYGYLIYSLCFSNQQRFWKVLIALSVPVCLALLSFPLQTDIIGYIKGGLSLIDGYNDAMNIKANEYIKYLAYAIILIGAFFTTFFFKNIKANLILLFVSLIFTFVLFKQGFVRSDLHVTAFFAIFPGICGLAAIFYEKISTIQTVILAVNAVICLWVGVHLGMYPGLGDRLNYLNGIKSPPDVAQRREASFQRVEGEERISEIIRDKSVDIIPWNIDYIYFSGLNYNPRPVVQSYSAYTPYLINLNKLKYESDSAPDYVIFSNQSIDGRYGFFDDQEAKINIIKNYACVDFSQADEKNKYLLFERKPGNAEIAYSSPVEKSIRFGEDYLIEDPGKTYYIKIDINYSLLGKLVRFGYKPFPIKIIFKLADGSEREHKAVVPILKNGVLINPLIEEEQDFYNFVKGIPASEKKIIKSFKIELDAPRKIIKGFAGSNYDSEINLFISEMQITRKN